MTNNPYRWGGARGYYTDSTGRVSIRARSYEPANARWTSAGPIRENSVNGYLYALNSPVLLNDPSGLSPMPSGHAAAPAQPTRDGTKPDVSEPPLFAVNHGCTEQQQRCIREALKLAKDRLARNEGCFNRIGLCQNRNGTRNSCDLDELTGCIAETLKSTRYVCSPRGDGGCHGGAKNAAHTDTLCGLAKSAAAMGVLFPGGLPFAILPPAACGPCKSPFVVANNCAACPSVILAQTTTFLCTDSAAGLNPKLPCDDRAKTALANILVHEAAHSCVGGHDTTGGNGNCDECRRPDAYNVENAFRGCL